MNRTSVVVVALLLVTVVALGYYLQGGSQSYSDSTTAYPATLSQDEIQALLYMREEEKLARDVYLTLYEKWGIQIFKNIAESEQQHTDMVKYLIDKYGLEDPAKEGIGEFSNPEIQELYNKLVEEGSKSEIDALKVGAMIEELDIRDIRTWLEKVDNEDIIQVFNNLINGSKNHLRAFVSVLKQYGVGYEPQIISKEEFEEIVSSAPGAYGQQQGKG